MEKLEKLIIELDTKIKKQEVLVTSISKSPVGWHIEHILLTIIIVINQLIKSEPTNYKWNFNFKRIIIFILNNIPRGIGKAPNAVKPKNDFNSETLKKHIETAKNKMKEITTLNKNSYFEHPLFGKLNLKPTVKFLCIHTKHHLKIINDIIEKRNL